MTETASLWTLFASSFLAATLLPGGSEAVLYLVLRQHDALLVPALALATVGNTLGGMSSYLIGRLIPERQPMKQLDTVRRYGAASMLAAWVPIVGDPMCVAAGWLRLPWLACTLWMALGKLGRYLVVAAGAT